MSVNMQVSLGGLLMKNPVTTASGTFASGKEYCAVLRREPPWCDHYERALAEWLGR